MTRPATVLAFDLGASSGRAILGRLDPATGLLTTEEIHRFPNDPVRIGERLHWDILRLYHEIKTGIVKARQLLGDAEPIRSIGIDSWAVDFGLLSASGELLGNPYHYRDRQNEGVMEQVLERLGSDRVYAKTGLQFLPFNTMYQLEALKLRRSPILEQASTLLMIPDLLRYFLTGEKRSEFTNSTTMQLFNPNAGTWDDELLRELNIPASLLLPPVPSGTIVGTLQPSVQEELNVPPLTVTAVGEHDTASAVAAVPASEPHFAYLICGTWSLLGTETVRPVITPQSQAWNFTNEGGVYGTNRLLKNIMGLWLIQECKRVWDQEGKSLGFGRIVELASAAAPFRSFIDPDDEAFLNPAHMPKQIQRYCEASGQPVPQTEGEIARCIFESLALKYRYVLEKTEQLAGTAFGGLHMVGGGIQNELLCQWTADACGRHVWAGPVEASAIGNVIVQYMALGLIDNLAEARRIIRSSYPVRTYTPQETAAWGQAYDRFLKVIGLQE